MHRPLLPFVATALLLACDTASAPDVLHDNALPEDTVVQHTAKAPDLLVPAHLSNAWQLPSAERWDTYWQQQYADSTGDLRHRRADLDGDGTMDNALFLTRTDTTHRDSAYALVIGFGNGTDTTLTIEPWAEAEGHIGMGIALEPPGPMGHLGGEDGGEPEGTVDLKQPAVTLIYFEKASITWYWKNGSFHKVWTGD